MQVDAGIEAVLVVSGRSPRDESKLGIMGTMQQGVGTPLVLSHTRIRFCSDSASSLPLRRRPILQGKSTGDVEDDAKLSKTCSGLEPHPGLGRG